MIGRCAKPAPSSRSRIAPTMPSIMPLGATMSAPARAWLSAWLAEQFQRGVVVDVRRGRCGR